MLLVIEWTTSCHLSFSYWHLVSRLFSPQPAMPKTNGKLSAQQSNEICSGANDRLGIQREAKNELVFSKSLRFVPLHLTRLFELRKSCWEICDSQRVWKSQFSDDFVRNSLVFAKQHVVCDKTTRCSRNFKGLFSDYVRRNLFFFPRDFENVRRNFVSVRQIRGNIQEIREKFGENQEKVGECREKFENTSQICQRNGFELT